MRPAKEKVVAREHLNVALDYFACKNCLKCQVFSKVLKVKDFPDFLRINSQILGFSVIRVFLAVLIVHTHVYTVNINSITNYISCIT